MDQCAICHFGQFCLIWQLLTLVKRSKPVPPDTTFAAFKWSFERKVRRVSVIRVLIRGESLWVSYIDGKFDHMVV